MSSPQTTRSVPLCMLVEQGTATQTLPCILAALILEKLLRHFPPHIAALDHLLVLFNYFQWQSRKDLGIRRMILNTSINYSTIAYLEVLSFRLIHKLTQKCNKKKDQYCYLKTFVELYI